MGGWQQVAHLCSHLQNASRARLGLTSTPHNKQSLHLLLSLQRAGFLSFVTRSGAYPPDPASISSHVPESLTTANAASQRLWVGLKYSNNEPVLKNCRVISKPSRPVTAKLYHLERIARGWDAGAGEIPIQRGLNLGECMFVQTPRGIMEVREAVERKMGGQLICRVSP